MAAKISFVIFKLVVIFATKIFSTIDCADEDPQYESDSDDDANYDYRGVNSHPYYPVSTTTRNPYYTNTHKPKGHFDVILGVGAKAPPWPPPKSSSIDNLIDTLSKFWEKKQERRKGFSFVFCSHMCPAGTVCQGTRCVYPKPPVIGDLSLSGDDKDLDPYSIDSKTKKSKLKKILTTKLVQALTNDLLRKKGGRKGKGRKRKKKRKGGSKKNANRKDLKTKNG